MSYIMKTGSHETWPSKVSNIPSAAAATRSGRDGVRTYHCKHWDLFVEHGVKPVERAWVPVHSAWDTSLWSMGHQFIDHGHQL